MIKNRKKLGELLIEAGLIDQIQLNAALAYQREWGGRLGAALIRKGIVNENEMITVIEKQMNMKCIPIEAFEMPSEDMLRILKENTARKFGVFPLGYDGRTLTVATSDPTDLKAIDDLGFQLGVRIKPTLALESDISAAIDHFYNPMGTGEKLVRAATVQTIKMPQSETEFEIIRPHEEIRTTAGTAQGPIDNSVLGGMIDLLVEKGIFTREELAKKIIARKQ